MSAEEIGSSPISSGSKMVDVMEGGLCKANSKMTTILTSTTAFVCRDPRKNRSIFLLHLALRTSIFQFAIEGYRRGGGTWTVSVP
jgi:hypothetical protein